IAIPQFASIEIVTGQPGRAIPGDHPFTISRRRSRALRIGAVGQFLALVIRSLLPKQLARRPIETEKRPPLFLGDGLRDKNPVAPNNRSRVPAIGQRHAPADILVGAPPQRELGLITTAIPVGTAPSRPVGRRGRGGGEEGKQNQSREGTLREKGFHGAILICLFMGTRGNRGSEEQGWERRHLYALSVRSAPVSGAAT